MSDVSKINELIEEIRDGHERQDRREGEPPMCLACSPADWPCDAVRAANALEAATRVPVQGEPNDDREALIERVRDLIEDKWPEMVCYWHPHRGDEDRQHEWEVIETWDVAEVALESALDSRATVSGAATEAIERVRAVLSNDELVWSDGSYTNVLVVEVKDVLAALDGAPEPEWEAVAEYGVKYAPTNNRASYTMRFGYESREDAEHSLGRLGRNQKRNPDRLMYREVRTGPWLPVEGENK